MLIIAIISGRIISWFGRIFNLGAGGTWPGEVALILNPNILQGLVAHIKKGIIVVAGTNGKTTTSLMIVKILEQHGYSVVHNSSGANLLNGVVSACIQKANWLGKLSADWGVFEVDENSLPIVISQLSSRLSETHGGIYHNPKSGVKDSSTPLRFARNDNALIIVLLNLFRDQLDRYGEVDVIAEKWSKALKNLPAKTTFVLNADDPLIAHLGNSVILEGVPLNGTTDRILDKKILSQQTSSLLQNDVKVRYFGIEDKTQFLKTREHATDSTFCLSCGHHLNYSGIYFSHLGIWKCDNCGAKRPQPHVSKVKIGLPGLYNEYNALAALSVAKSLNLDDQTTNDTLQNFQPAFGRQEEFVIDSIASLQNDNPKRIKVFLAKNPAGFNASLRTVLELISNCHPRPDRGSTISIDSRLRGNDDVLLLILNDRIPDGRDVSWIWDVDFEMIPENMMVIVSGDRVYDLALRVKYAQKSQIPILKFQSKPNRNNSKPVMFIEPGLKNAIQTGLGKIKAGETLYVLPTYSAMLEVRKILGGRKIL